MLMLSVSCLFAASTDGQAIAYLGNSSWGYVSTSVNYPRLFYQQLLLDSLPVISEVHYLAKLQLLGQYGSGDVNRVFNYCNILFGDPLIGFKRPPKPNFSITSSSFNMLNNFPTDIDDSLQIKLELINFGKALNDSVLITIKDTYLGSQSYFREFQIPIPLYKKNIYLSIPIYGIVGEHQLEVIIDKNNFFDEIYEDDNSANFSFIVYSTSVRPIESERFYNSARSDFKFLNPVFLTNANVSSIKVAIAENTDFTSFLEADITMDTLFTGYKLPSLQSDKRYWWRAKLNLSQANWSEPYSFFNENVDYNWYFNNSFNYSDVQVENVAFDSSANGWKLNRI
ncbi:MAG: hypothetical protein U5J96_02950 [Ignavibacteriaceae bacterium]|nr:hypothetical protein [Ignavibacteriaceae bacterium]